ncbi:natriuretic peptides B [Thomomys bottae]
MTQPSGNMGLFTVPCRAVLLLFFLSWMPLGGRSHPLAASGQGLELWEIQELLDRLKSRVSSGLEAEPTAGESLRQSPGPLGSGEDSVDGNVRPRESSFRAVEGLKVSKKVASSSCFGRRIDRISSSSSLGCKVLKRN